MNGPLKGVKILDVSRVLAGPFCTMLLADLGAEVVKVEQPGRGDPARHLRPFVDEDSAYFISVNRGKKGITLDLSMEEGQSLFRNLLPSFDVLVENFVPGTMARFGLDYDSVKEANPHLIYASISGFGQSGPYSRRPAVDIIVQAMGGILSLTGEPGQPPIRPGASLGDSVAGLFTALAIVSGLFQRAISNKGQYIDTSMLDCQVTMMENAFARYFATDQVPGPLGSRHPATAPFQAFHGSDGDFVVAMLTDDPLAWHRFCFAIERHDLADDTRYQDNSGRVMHTEELSQALQQTFRKNQVDYWLSVLLDIGVPCGPVNTIKDVFEDAQVKHRGMIASIPHRSRTSWMVANSPFRFSDNVTGPTGSAPELGGSTQEVLQSFLNLSDEKIENLRGNNVI